MTHLIFPDLPAAQQRSQQEAQRRGCGGTTAYWWGWVEHDDGRAALAISGDVEGLDVGEVAALAPLTADWLPEEVLQ